MRLVSATIVFFWTFIAAECRWDFCRKMCWDGEVQRGCVCKGYPNYCSTLRRVNWTLFRELMLDMHNDIRSRTARGLFAARGFPNAANMRAFSYDYDLEYTARCHSKQCLMEHNDCAATPNFDVTGQNIFKQTYPVRDRNDFTRLSNELLVQMETFYGTEIEEIIPNYLYDYASARLTQIMWAETTHVGCWQVKGGDLLEYFTTNDQYQVSRHKFNHMITCNYGPGGNFENRPVYQVGPAASNCSNGSDSNAEKKYPGLCGKAELPPPPFPDREYGYDDPADGARKVHSVNREAILLALILNFVVFYSL